MQGLVQNGLPSYSWEELHFLLWLKLFPGFVLFCFWELLRQKQVVLWAEGKDG